MQETYIEEILKKLTLEEKIGMIHGAGLFRTEGVERLSIPPLYMSDGPMGVRAEFADNEWRNVGTTEDYVTYLPCNSAIASTWNRDLAKKAGKVGIISVGWDPGMFSLNRMYANAILPDGQDYTFWGKGVSQGHSDAIRRVEGVKDGKQYTIPVESALEAVRNCENPVLTTRQKHTRECFVVLEEGADAAKVEETIKNMPNYFADYDTTVHFISEEELKKNHSGIPHGGFVIRTGKTGWNKENSHVIEYSLKLDSNPEFTSCVIVAYARAAYRLYKEGQSGCKTVFDIAPAYLSAKDGAELRKNLL